MRAPAFFYYELSIIKTRIIKMKKKKDPRRMLDQFSSRTNANDGTDHQIGLREDLRVHYSGEDDPHDG